MFVATVDTADSVTAVVSGSSSTPTGSSNSPTSGASSSPTPATPEFPNITMLIVFLAIATSAIALAAKQQNKNKPALENVSIANN